MRKYLLTLLFFMPELLLSARSDTISFFSNVFNQQREIVVYTPEDSRYRSDLVKLPVIYILDGQHEWFVNPVLNNIEYLQYTYEMPAAILVVIPHTNRNRECAISEIGGDPLPLHQFITQEVEQHIEKYNPNRFRLIIGHSFSASFALYAFVKGNGFFTAVIAHSPMDQLENLVMAMREKPATVLRNVCISVGSIDHDKDKYHRQTFESARKLYPALFSKINLYEADEASHNAVPIVANPLFLNRLFYTFSRRYGQIAEVDSTYSLVLIPESPEREIGKMEKASRLGPWFYAPEIGEIFGLASRYLNSGFNEHAKAVYEEGLKYYPGLYDISLALYELSLETDTPAARKYLLQARDQFLKYEKDKPDGDGLLLEIENEIRKNGW